MENYLFLEYSSELEQLSKTLGYSKTLFLGRDFILVKGSFKEILNSCHEAQRKKLLTIYIADNEEMLRSVVEKSPVDVVMGMEKLFGKDSFHYPKSGLNHILCRFATEKGKKFAFSFSDVLNAKERGRMIHRIGFNFGLCQEYGVKVIWSNFSSIKEEMRSNSDLEAVRRVLEKVN